MKGIGEIDKNFKSVAIAKDDMVIYDIESEPFDIYGVHRPEGYDMFVRMPRDAAEAVSDGVAGLNHHTAGGRVRFKTDSPYIAVKCVYPSFEVMPHMPMTGSSCCDIYADGEYRATVTPDWDFYKNYCRMCDDNGRYQGEIAIEKVLEFPTTKMRDIIINFPLYNAVNKVFVGISETARLEKGDEYKVKKPVVFYGSSITQGGCVSRPGNLYCSVLSRWYDFDYIDLGFSGSAKGEDAMAEYIAGLDMSIFVYDYDHNANTVLDLKNTHYKMYKTIRDAHPDIPIIMASRPSIETHNSAEVAERINVIEETLKRAKAEGDTNIYFVNGTEKMFRRYDEDMMTVDGCHPNDFGSFCMAEAFGDVIKELI